MITAAKELIKRVVKEVVIDEKFMEMALKEAKRRIWGRWKVKFPLVPS